MDLRYDAVQSCLCLTIDAGATRITRRRDADQYDAPVGVGERSDRFGDLVLRDALFELDGLRLTGVTEPEGRACQGLVQGHGTSQLCQTCEAVEIRQEVWHNCCCGPRSHSESS